MLPKPTNPVNNMLPNIFELVLRERFTEKLNGTKLQKKKIYHKLKRNASTIMIVQYNQILIHMYFTKDK